MMPLLMESAPKRIVFEYTEGVYKGLRQIIGTTDQLPVGQGLPTFAENAEFRGHRCALSLVRVTPRMVRYRELILPTSARGPVAETFHPEQQ